MNNTVYKSKLIRVKDKVDLVPSFLGRRGKILYFIKNLEKCYNVKMINYTTGAKNNFGPVKIKKSLKKKVDPY